MNKRQLEVEKAKLKDEKMVLSTLKHHYEQAAEDIAKKIEIHSGRINAMLEDFDNLSDDDKTVLRSQIYRKNFQEQLKAQIDSVLDDMNVHQKGALEDYLKKCYDTGLIGSMYDLHGQGIPLILPINQSNVLKAASLNPKLSNKLYGKYMTNLKKLIRNEISRGIVTGDSYSNIARNIANRSNQGFNKAMRIVRTEGHRIHSSSALDAMYEARDAGADVVKQWDATLDGKTRKNHRKLDGQIRELDEPFEVGGHKAMYPSDFGRPEEDINCRCTVQQRAKWALDDDELETLKKRAEFFELDKAKDFDDFSEKYLNAAGSSGKMKAKNGFKTINGSHSIENDIGTPQLPVCNPNFKKKKGYDKNCGYCSVTYEMRRRGYDVVANPLNLMYVNDWEKLFDGATPKRYVHKKGASIAEELSKQLLDMHEDGARGSIFVQWKGRKIGHFFSWEIEGGKVRFIDGQNGNTDASGYFTMVKPSSIITIRWDGLNPSKDANGACKNRG